MRPLHVRQGGVAVVTALLLTTLAVTIVASLFWQQQVQIRAMENQRLQLQTKWALRVDLDWARRILRDDAMSSSVDHLDEQWAAPMSNIRLDEYVENGRADSEASNATLTGSIVDAQSRYNLSNLAQNGLPNPQEILVFGRLLASLRADPALAKATAAAIASTQMAQARANPALQGAPPATPPVLAPELAQLSHTVDLLTVPGFSISAFESVKEFVVLLPGPSALNVNTASPEMLAAQLNLSAPATALLVASRAKAYFKDGKDFAFRAGIAPAMPIATTTDYFLVNGKVRIDRASLDMQALIYRKKTGNTTIKWVRTY